MTVEKPKSKPHSDPECSCVGCYESNLARFLETVSSAPIETVEVLYVALGQTPSPDELVYVSDDVMIGRVSLRPKTDTASVPRIVDRDGVPRDDETP